MYTSPISRATTHGIEVMVHPSYMGERQSEQGSLHLHRYEVLIRNTTSRDVQLLARRWRIQDLCEPIQQVEGRGVIGVEPIIRAGNSYSYASGTALTSPLGAMSGLYWLVDLERNERFWVAIPEFRLESPWIWN
jgi:ApaG protein